MKFEEGMYVRTLKGIAKIIDRKLDPNDYYFQCWVTDRFLCICDDTEYLCDSDILKASYNIIDLIEVGDYVNGYKIEEVNNNLNEHKGICNCLDTYLWCVNELDKFEEIVIFENDIKSVVTKEQFDSIKYEVK